MSDRILNGGAKTALPVCRGSAKRQRTIDAFAHSFARNGYHGTGTRGIAENLGIKAASLYSHVVSKDAALEEVCRRGIVSPLGHLRTALAAATGMEARIRQFFALQRAELNDFYTYSAVYLHERRHLSSDALAQLNAISRQFHDEINRLFIDAEQNKELHNSLNVRNAGLMMIAVIRTFNQFYLEGPLRGFDDFYQLAVESFIRCVSSAPGPASAKANTLPAMT